MRLSSCFNANRKKILILFSFLIVLSSLGWWFYPEYGDSYSEQQRRLWNQYLDTFEPVVIDPNWYKEDEGSKDVYAKLGSILLQIDRLNLTGDITTISLKLPDKPTEGVFQEKDPCELRKLALAGDGNAALDLFHLNLANRTPHYNKRGTVFSGSRTVPKFRQITEQRKWITKAIENKRPGSSFLLDILLRQWLESYDYDWRATPFMESISKGYLDENSHYQEFLSCIRNGDVRLFQYGTEAYPGFRSGFLFQETKRALFRKINDKGKDGWFPIVDLMTSRDIVITQSEIFQEFDQPYIWAQKLRLPEWMPGKKRNSSQTLSDFRRILSLCKKAADAGDLEAQYIWMRFSLPAIRHIKRSTLHDILYFHRNLTEKGYRPYLHEFYRMLQKGIPPKKISSGKKDSARNAFTYSYPICYKIVLSHLPAGEVKQLSQQLQKFLFPPRPKPTQPTTNRLKQNWAESPDGFLSELPQLLVHKNPQIRELATEHITQLVQANDLSAILIYAALYQQGKSRPQDKTRALTLIRKAIEVVDSISPYEFLDGCFDAPITNGSGSIDYIARILFIRFNMDASTPGAKPEEAFLLAKKMYSAGQRQNKFEDKPGFILDRQYSEKDKLRYYIGQMYEHGIGTAVDLNEAVSFYTAGSEAKNYGPPDPYCPASLSRLYEEGKGVEQNDVKSLEYARKALNGSWRQTDELKAEVKLRIERLEQKIANKTNK